MARDRLVFICREPQDVMSQVVAAVLPVLRPRITAAWIDAIADGGWNVAQRPDLEALLAVEQREIEHGKRRKATGMGINLDVHRDDEFGLLARLAAYSINAEAWAESEELFSASDTGDHAWFGLTSEQSSEAAARLAEVRLSFEQVLTFFE